MPYRARWVFLSMNGILPGHPNMSGLGELN